MIFDSDAIYYGGWGRLQNRQRHATSDPDGSGTPRLHLYLPARSAMVLQPI